MSAYLVQYGKTSFVGRFAANGVTAARGTGVVVETVRGLERGTVLASLTDGVQPDGLTVRVAGEADQDAVLEAERLGEHILSEAERTAGDLPISVLDAEVLLDRQTAILHALPWGEVDLTPYLDSLSSACGLNVRLQNSSQTPTIPDPPTGCGKPDCGSGGGGCGTSGGCSTGGCSRGSAKTAEEMTAYFADLRKQMERRVPLS